MNTGQTALAPTSRRFAGHDLEQVSAARHWLLTQIGEDHPAAFVISLLGTELATNAVRHTASGRRSGHFEISVDANDERVWIGVVDQGAATKPSLMHPDNGADSGRGLGLVDDLADHWGVEEIAGGCLVWFLVLARQ
ncbi:ATP-binding protein [Actinomadura viridis]|uniref:ATP-binding protein n=1 Tax=Actinomadura viridis TaxID=58110 RepID=UPI0036AED7B8